MNILEECMNEIDYSKYYWQNELVRLRAPEINDWEIHFSNYFDSEARFLLESEIETPVNKTIEEEYSKNHYCDGYEKTGRISFTIETLDDKKVGGLNLNGINERHGTFGIGMQINKENRGKGYGTAAMKILLDYAFNERRLNKYQGFIIEGNIASETMLIKLGCVREGIIRGTTFHKGKYWNEIHYGLFAEEFNKKWKR
jgi:RimJ/RimL family protein N-acetyltransferase